MSRSKVMSVWLENRPDQEREVDVDELARAFIQWEKEQGIEKWPDEIVGQFLKEYRIEGKWFTWDMEGVDALIDAYYAAMLEEVEGIELVVA